MTSKSSCTCRCLCQQKTALCHFHPFDCSSIPWTPELISWGPHPHSSNPSLPEKGITANEARFFCHFVTVIPHVFVLVPPEIPPPRPSDPEPESFMSVIFRLSTRDQMVLKAALCLGASHLGRCLCPIGAEGESESLSVEKTRLAENAEEELSRRVDAFRTGLMREQDITQHSEEQTEAEALISSYCLLYLYNVSEGIGNGAWQERLNGASDVLLELLNNREIVQGIDREDSEGGALPSQRAFVEFFSYHYTLGGVTSHLQASKDTLTPSWRRMFAGCSSARNGLLPLGLIAQISALRSEAETAPSASMIVRAVEIWKDLDDWGHAIELPSDDHAISRAYTTACFIWLFSILYPESINDDRVQAVLCCRRRLYAAGG
ncbi:uncharacterized protein DSM5745_10197 [Aspergillus mulundensis]|uniref:Transcription factor domain-containing protein n=1 Tax=Aspergillus mulundensis TaxID=1810919 RepID=A0A3D8QMM2_9EURO|nr:hypothetical protein DSM5745_10197 [Aspergillus mulundensis]RDW63086.1 hypothetical protein DSM5745_10197 [Aspergillus mulundensis]